MSAFVHKLTSAIAPTIQRIVMLTRRRFRLALLILLSTTLVLLSSLGCLHATPSSQIQQARSMLVDLVEHESVNDESIANAANALIKEGSYALGLDIIQQQVERPQARAIALKTAIQTAVRLPDATVLPLVLEKALTIDSRDTRSELLLALAQAYDQLEQTEHSQAMLAKALSSTATIRSSATRAKMLVAIAQTENMAMPAALPSVLQKTLSDIESIRDFKNRSDALGTLAIAYDSRPQYSAQVYPVLEKALSAANNITDPYEKKVRCPI